MGHTEVTQRSHVGHAEVTQRSRRGCMPANQIFAHGMLNVKVAQQADPAFLRNAIHTSRAEGVLVAEGGKGHWTENVVSDNAAAGFVVQGPGRGRFPPPCLDGRGAGSVPQPGSNLWGAFLKLKHLFWSQALFRETFFFNVDISLRSCVCVCARPCALCVHWVRVVRTFCAYVCCAHACCVANIFLFEQQLSLSACPV